MGEVRYHSPEEFNAEYQQQRDTIIRNFREKDLKYRNCTVPYNPVAQPDSTSCFLPVVLD